MTDDGAGPPPVASSGPGMGVRIMQHRSELIGGRGEFTVGPAQPSGTQVRCRIARRSPAFPS